MKTAVVILNWNGLQHKLLPHYLPSVVEHTPANQADVIVADNGSEDDSLAWIAEQYPSVRSLPLGNNLGFAEGYNRAIAQLAQEGYEVVVLLNDDVRVSPHWLDPMLVYLEHNPKCAGLQPKLLKDWSFDGIESKPATFEYAGACGGYLDSMCYPYCRGRIFDTVEVDLGQYDLPEGVAWEVMWATGACLMVRTSLYLHAGGLDMHFFAHMEEIDLCWRLRRMGYTLACVPQSVVYHKGGASLPMDDPRKTKLNFRNSLLMMWKNLPAKGRSRKLFGRMLLDGVAALNFLLHGKPQHVAAIWHAHREARQMQLAKYPQGNYFKGFGQAKQFPEEGRSILWEYYVKGVNKFGALNAF